MSQNNSAHPALKSRRVQSLPGDLKDKAEMLIAEKFDLPLAVEGSDVMQKKVEQQFTPPPPPQPVFPRSERGYQPYTWNVCCGRCGAPYTTYSNPGMQLQQATYMQTSGIGMSPMQTNYQQYYSFSCPRCLTYNNGSVIFN